MYLMYLISFRFMIDSQKNQVIPKYITILSETSIITDHINELTSCTMLGQPVRRQLFLDSEKPQNWTYKSKAPNYLTTFTATYKFAKTSLDTNVFVSSLIKINCVREASETSLITLLSTRKH